LVDTILDFLILFLLLFEPPFLLLNITSFTANCYNFCVLLIVKLILGWRCEVKWTKCFIFCTIHYITNIFIFLHPDQKSGTLFCDFTNKCHVDGKTVTDLNRINFADLLYSFILQHTLIKTCWLFPNYTVNYQNPIFMHLLHKIRQLVFGQDITIF